MVKARHRESWLRRNRLAVSVFVLTLGLLVWQAWTAQSANQRLAPVRALALAELSGHVESEVGVLLAREAVESFEHPSTVSRLQAAVGRHHRHVDYPDAQAAVSRCVFSADGERLLASAANGSARWCDLNGRELGTFRTTVDVFFGSESTEVILRRGDGIYRWTQGPGTEQVLSESTLAARLVDQQLIVVADATGGATLINATGPHGLANSDRAWTGARIGARGDVVAWDRRRVALFDDEGTELAKLEVDSVGAVSNGARALIVSRDNESWLARYRQEGSSFELVRRLHPQLALAGFARDDRALAVSHPDRSVHVFTIEGTWVGAIPDQGVAVRALEFSPDGEMIAIGGGDGTTRLFSRQGRSIASLPGRAPVTCIAFSDDQERIAVGSLDGKLRVFEVRPDHLLTGHRGRIVGVDWADDGAILSVDSRGDLRFRSSQHELPLALGGRVVRARFVGVNEIVVQTEAGALLVLDREGLAVSTLVAAPDGDRIADLAATASTVVAVDELGIVWHAKREDGQWPKAQLFPGNAALLAVDVSPAGDLIASGGRDGSVRLYSTDGELRQEYRGHDDWIWSVRFSPRGGRFLTTSRDNEARVWTRSGQFLTAIHGTDGTMTRGEFSPDGSLIVTGSTSGAARVWNARGNERCVLRGHSGEVHHVAFSPDGEFALSGSDDSTLRIWPVRTSRLIEIARRLVPRSLTSREKQPYAEYFAGR